MPTVSRIDLRENGLTDRGAADLVRSLPDSIRLLDLSCNSLGRRTTAALVDLLGRAAQLVRLHLQQCSLSDANIAAIAAAVAQSKCLRLLDISHNRLGPTGAKAMAAAIRSCATLRKLNLAWCGLRRTAADAVINSVAESGIDTLDVSYNALGNSVAALCAALRCKSLRHLDCSACSLPASARDDFGAAIAANPSLCGIHFDTGCANVCTSGALKPPSSVSELQSPASAVPHKQSIILCPLDEDDKDECMLRVGTDAAAQAAQLKPLQGSRLRTSASSSRLGSLRGRAWEPTVPASGPCWLCESWSEVEVRFAPPASADAWSVSSVSLCTEVEGFRGIPMTKHPSGDYRVWHMLPPGPIHAFFRVLMTNEAEDEEEGEEEGGACALPCKTVTAVAPQFGTVPSKAAQLNPRWLRAARAMQRQASLPMPPTPKGRARALPLSPLPPLPVASPRSVWTTTSSPATPQPSTSPRRHMSSRLPSPRLHVSSVDALRTVASLNVIVVPKRVGRLRRQGKRVRLDGAGGGDVDAGAAGAAFASKRAALFAIFPSRSEDCDGGLYDDDAVCTTAVTAGWELMRASNICKSPEDADACKGILTANFLLVLDMFRHFVAVDSGSGFQMGLKAFTAFNNDCGLLDGKRYNVAAMDRVFISSNVDLDERLSDNSRKSMALSEFMEAIVRIALTKYVYGP